MDYLKRASLCQVLANTPPARGSHVNADAPIARLINSTLSAHQMPCANQLRLKHPCSALIKCEQSTHSNSMYRCAQCVTTRTEQNEHISSREHAWLKIAHLCVPKQLSSTCHVSFLAAPDTDHKHKFSLTYSRSTLFRITRNSIQTQTDSKKHDCCLLFCNSIEFGIASFFFFAVAFPSVFFF